MKKSLLILFVLTLVFSACEGPEGPRGEDGGLNITVIPFHVTQNQWELKYGGDNYSNPYYVCEKRAPQITEYIYEDCILNGYLFLNPGESYESQTPLPYVLAAETETGIIYDWIEIVHVEYEIGLVRFIVTYNDFDTSFSPDEMYFRVVLSW